MNRRTSTPEQIGIDFGPEFPAPAPELRRDFQGYAQFRDEVGAPWRFYVSGFDSTFDGEAGRCTVLMADDSLKWVPIDAQGRITINRRKYDRTHWNH